MWLDQPLSNKKEISKVLQGVKSGSVDVVIGTHRLLSKDVVFKDLGLVIVDEEQRVLGWLKRKELKELTTNWMYSPFQRHPSPAPCIWPWWVYGI